MFNVGTGELLVILLVALIVLGPDKLPETARKIGNVVGELRRMSQGFQDEVRRAMQDSSDPSPVTDATSQADLPPAPPKLESVPDEPHGSHSDDSAA